jgi:hypothetical protein
MWTKRELVEEAYSELALAGYTFDLTPEEMQAGLRRLDAQMASWEALGIHVGYNLPARPSDSDLDQDSGLPDYVNEAAFMNLAVRLAPMNGKGVHPSTIKTAKATYDRLLWAAAQPTELQMPNTMPRGSGNRTFFIPDPFMPDPNYDPLQVSQGGNLKV